MCAQLVMDTSDPDIEFDQNGVCNYWHEFQIFKETLPSPEMRRKQLDRKIEEIRSAGRTRRYDCLVGLSGGVDSSYLVTLTKELGLRPLVVHFDNGWNSELAVHNIERIVNNLDLELETFVMDWVSFRDLQRAYFKASVVDLEVPTDHLIFGALHRIAAKRGIRYLLSGTNHATEWLMPLRWNYRKNDIRNLRSIHRQFGERPLRKLPTIGVWSAGYYHIAHGVRVEPLLNLVDYSVRSAKQRLTDRFGWRDYGGKHYESVFTRFYQGYILPRKFGIDKRKAHLSNLILNGEMTRDEALRDLENPPYDEVEQRRDRLYVAKKLGFSADEFETILSLPNRSHESFGTDAVDRDRYFRLAAAAGRVRRVFSFGAVRADAS